MQCEEKLVVKCFLLGKISGEVCSVNRRYSIGEIFSSKGNPESIGEVFSVEGR